MKVFSVFFEGITRKKQELVRSQSFIAMGHTANQIVQNIQNYVTNLTNISVPYVIRQITYI